jgi:hypothetical protein
MNITVIPQGVLNFLTVYPTGQSLPNASTLNSLQGQILANAAIVPGGASGSVDAFATDPTDIVIDINGYYLSPTDLHFNTSTGDSALRANTIGNHNTANGYAALSNNTIGGDNTAIGAMALQYNTSGAGNTATGVAALIYNTTGIRNTANGGEAMLDNTTGFDNTAIGSSAMASNTAGDSNTAVGYIALALNTSGTLNTAVGDSALVSNTTGSNNIAIGYKAAGLSPASGSNNIHIGSQGSASDNGTIRIGTAVPIPFCSVCGAQSAFFAAGIRGITTGENDAIPVVIDSNGQLGTVNSSRRFKENIEDMADASSGLLRLRPVTFRYRKPFADGSKPIQYGLIAEEVEEIYPELVAHSADGQSESVKYQVLDSMLLNEVQRQHAKITSQAEQIRALAQQLKEQQDRVEQLASRLAAMAVQ